MDGIDIQVETICCDTAEDIDFDQKEILNQCEYAEEIQVLFGLRGVIIGYYK